MAAEPALSGPAVQIVDQSFARYRLGATKVERLATGFRWSEGPVWFGDGRYLLWSDIPNNRIMRWDEETGAVTVFRKPSNFANGNTRDRQGRLLTCEHGTRRVSRTEYDGTITTVERRRSTRSRPRRSSSGTRSSIATRWSPRSFHNSPSGAAGTHSAPSILSLGIWKFGKNADLAKELIQFLFRKENYDAWIVASNAFNHPPLKHLADHPIWTKNPRFSMLPKEAEYGHARAWPARPSAVSRLIDVNFVLPDMIAKALAGMPTNRARAWAEDPVKLAPQGRLETRGQAVGSSSAAATKRPSARARIPGTRTPSTRRSHP